MLYTLVVKPLALAAVGLVVWLLWHALDHLDAAAVRRHRLMVGAGGGAIAAIVLGPAAWATLTDYPGEVAAWSGSLVVASAAIWAYARLIAAARRRGHRRHGPD